MGRCKTTLHRFGRWRNKKPMEKPWITKDNQWPGEWKSYCIYSKSHRVVSLLSFIYHCSVVFPRYRGFFLLHTKGVDLIEERRSMAIQTHCTGGIKIMDVIKLEWTLTTWGLTGSGLKTTKITTYCPLSPKWPPATGFKPLTFPRWKTYTHTYIYI